MISALRLGTFKAFDASQDFPIRPLTLIYGPNSAGKSSIIHSLVLAHHAAATGDLDVHRTSVGGESVDLGGFRQYVHRHDVSRTVAWGVTFPAADLKGPMTELVAPASRLSVELFIGQGYIDERQPLLFGGFGRTTEPQGVRVERYALAADGADMLVMSARHGGTLRLDRVDMTHPVMRHIMKNLVLGATSALEVDDTDLAAVAEAVDALVPEITARADRFFPRLTKSSELVERLMVPVAREKRREDLAAASRLYFPHTLKTLVDGISEHLASRIETLRYLGPLRSYPPRHLGFSPEHDPNWQAGGGQAWDVLRRNDEVRSAVNVWLARDFMRTPYEVIVRNFLPKEQLEDVVRSTIERIQRTNVIGTREEWIEEHGDDDDYDEDTGMARNPDKGTGVIRDTDEVTEEFKAILDAAAPEHLTDIALIDKRTQTVVSHRDVGIGVSQVLPVLVAAISLQECMLAVEQPEIHLHPALQAEIADVFIDAALRRRNTLLLETHSEHLLLRIMRRMRQTAAGALPEEAAPVGPEDVAVLYVEPLPDRTLVREMPLNEQGQLVKAWPGGFFEEGLRETF